MINIIANMVKFELLLFMKERNFWLVFLLMNVYSWAAFVLAGQIMSGVAQMFIPLLGYLAIEIVTREKRDNFTEITQSLPYNDYIFLSRIITILLLFLLLGTVLTLAILLVSLLPLPIYVSYSAWLAFVIKYAMIGINVSSLMFFVASLSRKPSLLYAALFVWWISGIFVTSNAGILFPLNLAIANFTYIGGFGGNPSEISGLFPNGDLIAGTILFQIAFSIMLMVFALAIARNRSIVKLGIFRTKIAQGLTYLVMVLLVGLVAVQYSHVKKEQSSAISGNSIVMAKTYEQSTIIVDGYDLNLSILPEQHKITAKAKVELRNSGTSPAQIYFTLLEYLNVQEVKNAVSGELLEWVQEGPYLTVSTLGQFDNEGRLNISFDYAGRVWEWRNDFYGHPAGLVNFVAKPFTFLRGGYAWYPIIGRHQTHSIVDYKLPWLKAEYQMIQHIPITYQPVRFNMTVNSEQDLTIISNLKLVTKNQQDNQMRYEFKSNLVSDVFLLAGPYEYTQITTNASKSPLDCYYFPSHGQNINKIAHGYSQIIKFYDSLIPNDFESTIIFESPRFLTYDTMMRTNNNGLIGAIPITEALSVTKALWSPWWSQSSGHALTQARILNLWWPNCFNDNHSTVADGFAIYMFTLFKEHQRGRMFYDDAKEYWLSYNENSPDNEEMLGRRGYILREVFLLMDAIRKSKLGDAGVKEFLRIINAQYKSKRVIETADIILALDQVGVFSGEKNSKGNDSYHTRIENINRLLNQSESSLQGTLKFKLNWDFSPEVKIIRVN
ncbi:hypothetical protein [Dendrosporobacter sp. 1207_IL3150]|uniref:hypothetical protein n=1 Tax=Dendrosporobacter sp. 1207_IL3150 TaxID=3084054 RepID=UPI002FD95461